MNRNQRKQMAEETLRIVERGAYTNPAGLRVDVAGVVDRAVAGTRLCTPGELEALVGRAEMGGGRSTDFEVVNETTLSACRRLVVDRGLDGVLALNFASAKNAGGGFLGGSQAQEESLARSSALYASLLAAPEYYERNRACGTALYTDHMILSPQVPVFRDDAGRLLDTPYAVSFLTAPAVNAGAIRRNQPGDVELIRPTMARRSEMVLAIAAEQGYRHLVLGAWGCGVFKNEPAEVARQFAALLTGSGRYAQTFETVVFAVLDHSADEVMIRPFRDRLAGRGEG